MPGIIEYLFVFLFGIVFGSFFNVLIYRLPRGLSIVTPPSSCTSCKGRIGARDNIPLLSYLLLKGKCRSCGHPISPRYPLVELAAGTIFLVSYSFDSMTPLFVRDTIFYSILLMVALIDIDTRIIPDIFSIGGFAVGVFMEWILLGKGIRFPLIGALTGSGILFLTAVVYEKLTGREGLGMGDVKLLAAVGAFTGYMGSILTIFAGSMVGAIIGITLMVREGKDMKMAIPFGPFLALGAALADIFLRNYTITF